jgi:aminoglycoside 6'-N-acetyltransferase I
MKVRLATRDDLAAWSDLRAALWPDADPRELRTEAEAHFAGGGLLQAVFVCEDGASRIAGMLELSYRPYADGCVSSPVPYVEGWYVLPDARRRGVGRALITAAERWAVTRGHCEIASDALIENAVSERAHKTLGFEEVERVIHFRKSLQEKRGG